MPVFIQLNFLRIPCSSILNPVFQIGEVSGLGCERIGGGVNPWKPRTRKQSRWRSRNKQSLLKRSTTMSSGLSIAQFRSSKLWERITNALRFNSSACHSRPSISWWEQAVICAWRNERLPSWKTVMGYSYTSSYLYGSTSKVPELIPLSSPKILAL